MSQQEAEFVPLFAAATPLVLAGDTGVLMNEVVRSLRQPHLTSLLSGLHRQVVRLYIASHVFAEMERDLPDFARERGCACNAFARWQADYLPWIRVVDVPSTWGLDDPAVQAVFGRHAVDGPTAQLASTLGCPTLAEDQDLVDNGFGSKDWLQLTLHTGGLAFQSETLQVIYVPSALAVELGKAAVGAFMRAPASAQVLAVGVCMWLVYNARDSEAFKAKAKAAGAGALQGAQWAMPRIEQLRTWQAAGEEEWSRQRVLAAPVRSLEQALAQMLSTALQPLLAGDLARSIDFDGDLQERTRVIRQVLNFSPAFVEVSRGRWQLGRPGGPERFEDDGLAQRRIAAFTRTLEMAGAHLEQSGPFARHSLRVALPFPSSMTSKAQGSSGKPDGCGGG